MDITLRELVITAETLGTMRSNTPLYKILTRFRLKIMAETLWGIVAHIQAHPKRSCGCAAHTNPGAN